MNYEHTPGNNPPQKVDSLPTIEQKKSAPPRPKIAPDYELMAKFMGMPKEMGRDVLPDEALSEEGRKTIEAKRIAKEEREKETNARIAELREQLKNRNKPLNLN